MSSPYDRQPIYAANMVKNYVSRVGGDSLKAKWIPGYMLDSLVINRLSWEAVTDASGCYAGGSGLTGAPGGPSPAAGIVGSAGSLAGGTVGGLGTAGVIASSTIPIPVVGLFIAGGAALVGALIGIFTAHHNAAVRTERADICSVTQKYNAFAPSIEQAISTGKITLTDAISTLSQAHALMIADLAAISNSKQENAGFGVGKAIDALQLFNQEVVYPSLVPGVAQNAINAVSSVTQSPVGLIGLAGAGIVGAKVVGVF